MADRTESGVPANHPGAWLRVMMVAPLVFLVFSCFVSALMRVTNPVSAQQTHQAPLWVSAPLAVLGVWRLRCILRDALPVLTGAETFAAGLLGILLGLGMDGALKMEPDATLMFGAVILGWGGYLLWRAWRMES